MSQEPDQAQAETTAPDPVPAATMKTAPDAADVNKVYDLVCDLQRSIRYHRARERFFDSWSNWISFVSLLAGSSVVVSILADQAPEWVAIASGAIVVALQALEQVFRLSHKARDHNGFASEFSSLERIVTVRGQMTAAELLELQGEVLAIEAREPPIKRYLDLICHNQVARALGSSDVERLTWFQRQFAQYLNGDAALERGQ